MKHLPNILSVIRILMVPFIVWQIAVDNLFVAGILLMVSFGTDFLDGFLARRFQWSSKLGQVLDPAADKITQVAVSITLIVVMRQYWFLFAFLILKDIIMGLLGAALISRGVTIKGANWLGKTATFTYYFTVIFIILFPQAPPWLTLVLLILMVLTALAAGLSYIPNMRVYAKEARQNSNKHPGPQSDAS